MEGPQQTTDEDRSQKLTFPGELKMADSCQNPSIQIRLSLVFPLELARLAWGLKQIPRKNDSSMLTEISKKVIPKSMGFSMVSAIVVVLKSCASAPCFLHRVCRSLLLLHHFSSV